MKGRGLKSPFPPEARDIITVFPEKGKLVP